MSYKSPVIYPTEKNQEFVLYILYMSQENTIKNHIAIKRRTFVSCSVVPNFLFVFLLYIFFSLNQEELYNFP